MAEQSVEDRILYLPIHVISLPQVALALETHPLECPDRALIARVDVGLQAMQVERLEGEAEQGW